MEATREKVMELATRIYELDGEVYRCLGSSLGRVYTGSRTDCIEGLARLMCSGRTAYLLRSELALVGNMARTIPDKDDCARVMDTYNALLREVQSLPESFGTVDIQDKERIRLNQVNLRERFSENDHLVICIGRSQGCAGTDIGFALADALKINFYDTEIFNSVLKRLQAEQDQVPDSTGSDVFSFQPSGKKHGSLRQWLQTVDRYHGLPKEDAVFFNQSDLICQMAKKEDFIVMGRCADMILANNRIPHISVFITAPFELRVQRMMETHGLDHRHAARLLKKLDRRRGRYYRFYTGLEWGSPINYDLCLNSASYGIEKSVELIARMINRQLPPPEQK